MMFILSLMSDLTMRVFPVSRQATGEEAAQSAAVAAQVELMSGAVCTSGLPGAFAGVSAHLCVSRAHFLLPRAPHSPPTPYWSLFLCSRLRFLFGPS